MLLTAGLSVGGTLAVQNSLASRVGTDLVTDSPASGGAHAQSTSQTVPKVATSGQSADWQAVAKAVSPAVVTISVESSASAGLGSGVIYDAKGLVVTNDHVIANATGADGKISVTLADGRIFAAEVVGTDPSTDLALLQLQDPPADLTVATFGSSSSLSVGQEVMAIGAPLGLSNTATTGIISALDRPVEVASSESQTPSQPQGRGLGGLPTDPGVGQEQVASPESVVTNAIQVDASINPGNSGGPLFDASGAVIGINSSIASNSTTQNSAGSIGLGFAIPSDLVKSVVEQLATTGKVHHAVLGVSISTRAVQVDGASRAGAAVADLTAGGAAAKAGLQVGDVILAVDGKEVYSAKALTGYIRRYSGGDQVEVTYVRDGKRQEVQVTLAAK
ncbi:trypsin-like peptidase domain-containing protein [Schaalia sp. 19OD2882]|nr:trypsin-like peptidase domain-containing protein [Schaalia sp. 19OD2882]